ncbi:MAG: PH domain-containing protein [Planctomycetota bacterium]
MIQIICDNCERPFEVDPSEAGGKVPCPLCGDVNRVPADGASESPPAPAPAAAAPAAAAPAAAAASGDGVERDLLVVRPGMFRAHPVRYAFIVALFIVGLVGAIFLGVAERAASWRWAVWPALIASVVALVWFGWWWMSTHWWVKLVISNKRTVRHEGIVKRHTTEVLHNHVRSVDIQQTFFQRLFRVGTIGIDSAGQDDIEIQADDIPSPYRVKEVIDRHRKM